MGNILLYLAFVNPARITGEAFAASRRKYYIHGIIQFFGGLISGFSGYMMFDKCFESSWVAFGFAFCVFALYMALDSSFYLTERGWVRYVLMGFRVLILAGAFVSNGIFLKLMFIHQDALRDHQASVSAHNEVLWRPVRELEAKIEADRKKFTNVVDAKSEEVQSRKELRDAEEHPVVVASGVAKSVGYHTTSGISGKGPLWVHYNNQYQASVKSLERAKERLHEYDVRMASLMEGQRHKAKMLEKPDVPTFAEELRYMFKMQASPDPFMQKAAFWLFYFIGLSLLGYEVAACVFISIGGHSLYEKRLQQLEEEQLSDWQVELEIRKAAREARLKEAIQLIQNGHSNPTV